MKKILGILLIMCVLTGCNFEKTTDIKESEEQKKGTQSEVEKENAFPGSYTVPEGWVKSEEYSTEEKFFYLEEGHETEELPNNISINVGTNQYSTEEHTDFRDAIVQQLMVQLSGVKAELKGDGTYTEQGYPVYIFTIDEIDAGVVTKQYYIVGDYRYCLIHLTNYSKAENADEAAQAIADSFVWNEED